ncbi:unnamed protein product [Amoebophrya sp. A120]|nr:unnamed protein product [Amoebophrya sp. A120]|eukprot:GSA120T00015640001.1
MDNDPMRALERQIEEVEEAKKQKKNKKDKKSKREKLDLSRLPKVKQRPLEDMTLGKKNPILKLKELTTEEKILLDAENEQLRLEREEAAGKVIHKPSITNLSAASILTLPGAGAGSANNKSGAELQRANVLDIDDEEQAADLNPIERMLLQKEKIVQKYQLGPNTTSKAAARTTAASGMNKHKDGTTNVGYSEDDDADLLDDGGGAPPNEDAAGVEGAAEEPFIPEEENDYEVYRKQNQEKSLIDDLAEEILKRRMQLHNEKGEKVNRQRELDEESIDLSPMKKEELLKAIDRKNKRSPSRERQRSRSRSSERGRRRKQQRRDADSRKRNGGTTRPRRDNKWTHDKFGDLDKEPVREDSSEESRKDRRSRDRSRNDSRDRRKKDLSSRQGLRDAVRSRSRNRKSRSRNPKNYDRRRRSCSRSRSPKNNQKSRSRSGKRAAPRDRSRSRRKDSKNRRKNDQSRGRKIRNSRSRSRSRNKREKNSRPRQRAAPVKKPQGSHFGVGYLNRNVGFFEGTNES